MFGPGLYPDVMTWPRRLIVRAAQIQGQRDAEARLITLSDHSISSGLKLGEEYVDPKGTGRKADEPYTTLKPLEAHRRLLDRAARPWAYTLEAEAARLDWEQDAAFARLFGAMQA